MTYMAEDGARRRRADPRLIMPECRSILVLAIPYSAPEGGLAGTERAGGPLRGRIAAYALGDDYHLLLPGRLKEIVHFIEQKVGRPVANRWYMDTGPILERDLAQRAGLGWIGKNTCLINPKIGSYFLLAEILLDLDLEPDHAFNTDRCGTCRRCIEACPTGCILPDRTLDAGRCISYLTIEHRGEIAPELRGLLGNWIFGCDVCQVVCPWNRFAPTEGDAAFAPQKGSDSRDLAQDLAISAEAFGERFSRSPVRRARQAGYRRNVAIALGNVAGPEAIDALQKAVDEGDSLVAQHAAWGIGHIRSRSDSGEKTPGRHP
jgi:epoxyqueuosine reductase